MSARKDSRVILKQFFYRKLAVDSYISHFKFWIYLLAMCVSYLTSVNLSFLPSKMYTKSFSSKCDWMTQK